MKIVIDDKIPYIQGILEPYAYVDYIPGTKIKKADIQDCSALIVRTRTKCDKELLSGTPVQTIITATIGTDHIDMDYCRKEGISVHSAKGCNSRAVLQWVAAVLASSSQKYGWSPKDKSLGIVGLGNVGRLVEHYSRIWGFNVLKCDPPRQREEGGQYLDLRTLAANSDIITFHVPLNAHGQDRTYHMAGTDILSIVKPRTQLINSSRGEVVDSTALKGSLIEGNIRAFIDVWENEPAPDPELIGLCDISTPHIAGYSTQGKANATAFAVRTIAKEFSLPLETWYPKVDIIKPADIAWEDMNRQMSGYFNIEDISEKLKKDPENFEQVRNGYRYRSEFF